MEKYKITITNFDEINSFLKFVDACQHPDKDPIVLKYHFTNPCRDKDSFNQKIKDLLLVTNHVNFPHLLLIARLFNNTKALEVIMKGDYKKLNPLDAINRCYNLLFHYESYKDTNLMQRKRRVKLLTSLSNRVNLETHYKDCKYYSVKKISRSYNYYMTYLYDNVRYCRFLNQASITANYQCALHYNVLKYVRKDILGNFLIDLSNLDPSGVFKNVIDLDTPTLPQEQSVKFLNSISNLNIDKFYNQNRSSYKSELRPILWTKFGKICNYLLVVSKKLAEISQLDDVTKKAIQNPANFQKMVWEYQKYNKIKKGWTAERHRHKFKFNETLLKDWELFNNEI